MIQPSFTRSESNVIGTFMTSEHIKLFIRKISIAKIIFFKKQCLN